MRCETTRGRFGAVTATSAEFAEPAEPAEEPAPTLPSGPTRKMGPTLRLERKFWEAGDRVVVGIDEVGRGAWAGPVTVAAVVPATEHVRGVRDSKQLTRPEREKAARSVRRGGARPRGRAARGGGGGGRGGTPAVWAA